MDNRGVDDVSYFKLYDATGDSKGKSNPVKAEQWGIDCDDQDLVFYVAKLVNDDAESCSSDTSDPYVRDAKRRKVCEAKDKIGVDGKIEKQPVDAYRDTWYRKDDEMENQHTVSVESRDEELANEKEENRLFWEACLAA